VDVIKSISLIEGYGNANILVFPLSFIADNIETLYDIDIVQANAAQEYGIKCFKRCTSFNDNPHFIEVLGDIFRDHLKKIHRDIKVKHEDDLDRYLNFALVDNNIKKYIDGPIDSKKNLNNHYSHLHSGKVRNNLTNSKRNKILLLFILFFAIFIFIFIFSLSKIFLINIEINN